MANEQVIKPHQRQCSFATWIEIQLVTWIEIQGYNVGRAYGTFRWYQETPEVFEGWLLALAETE